MAEAKPVRRKAAATKSPRRKPADVQATAARPKRAKKTLGDDFAAALRADFRAHGAGVIAAVRAEKPEQYLKVVLTLLPKDFSPKDFSQGVASENSLERLSDEEIRTRIRGLEASVRPFLDATDLSGAARGDGEETPQ